MLLINNVNLPLETDFKNIKSVMEGYLKTPLKSARLYKKSVDARKKQDMHFCCSVLVELNNEQGLLRKNKNARFWSCVFLLLGYKLRYPAFLLCKNDFDDQQGLFHPFLRASLG